MGRRVKGSAYDGRGSRKYLNRAEAERFVAATCRLPVDRELYCLALYYSGARPSEILEVTSESLEPDIGILKVRCLKKRDREIYRRIPIPSCLMARLDELASRSPGDRLWTFSRSTAWRVVKGVMEKAEVSGVQASPKGLRHAYGVHGIMRQVPLSVVSKWMGHEDIETTTIYLDVQDEEERKLMQRMWGFD